MVDALGRYHDTHFERVEQTFLSALMGPAENVVSCVRERYVELTSQREPSPV